MKAEAEYDRSDPEPREIDRETDDAALVEALRRGDEVAFATLIDRYSGAMLRVARLFTDDAALAEDALQDAWLGVLRGIDRFQGRASLRTWIFRIMVNRLKASLRREHRAISWSATADAPAVDPERFLEADHPRWPGHWKVPPRSWGESPEKRLLSEEVGALLSDAIARLPDSQRIVITLRDVDGWSAQEVCTFLKISEANQRVLLHRARAKVRHALEHYLSEG